MTQAFNLSQFANNVNSSGQTSNAGLQNTSVTVTAGTGMSGGGAVALGSSVTLTNAGVTSVTAGTGISVSASTGGVTITNTQSAGLTVAQLGTFNGVGSLSVLANASGSSVSAGGTKAGSGLRYNFSSQQNAVPSQPSNGIILYVYFPGTINGSSVSGTWTAMGPARYNSYNCCGTPVTEYGLTLWVRTA
jgi:hypothetical protein